VSALVSIAFVGRRLFEMLVAYLPEVLYNRIALGVATVVGVLLPVVDIDVCYATDEQLELTLVEDVDEIGGNELVEALNKGVKLFINTLLNAPLCNESASLVSEVSAGEGHANGKTYSTYSFLFSFVTSMSLPPSLRSTITFSPNRSSSTEKVE
jgi:hypothetical protein